MRQMDFDKVKPLIIEVLEKKNLGIGEPLSLVDGFFIMPLHPTCENFILVGASTVPMVVLFGENTGRIYHFALKAILPDWEWDKNKEEEDD